MLSGALTLGLSLILFRLHRQKGQQKEATRNVGPPNFWIPALEAFVLALSDQQLITGALLLLCGYGKYWASSVRCGGNNLWVAADIVCFSSVTHAATLLALRDYFRRHRTLATCRVCAMYIIYAFWLVVVVHIIKPNRSKTTRPRLPNAMSDFWHAAAYIEAIGVMYAYLLTYLPIFLSQEAADVRRTIASGSMEDHTAAHEAWGRYRNTRPEGQTGCPSGSQPLTRRLSSTVTRLNPYKRLRHTLTDLAFNLSEHYLLTPNRSLRRRLLRYLAEVLFPWSTTPYLLAVLWLFGLSFMSLNLHQNGDAGRWSLGQLLPPFLVLLPLLTLLGSLAGMYD